MINIVKTITISTAVILYVYILNWSYTISLSFFTEFDLITKCVFVPSAPKPFTV